MPDFMNVRSNFKRPQRPPSKQPISDGGALQTFVKAESVDNDDYLEDGEDGDDDEDTYKPRPQLPKPFVNMRTLAHLMRDLENGVIDVDPEYQREVVWTADRMTGLINSLQENFYIPPIILNKKTQPVPNGSKTPFTLICVDGKQRLSSVRAFIKGMIPCHDHRGEKWWFCDAPSNRRRKVLPEETQRSFLSKEFVSFEFTDLSPEQEEDLFARVQMGVQLSLAEKMRASTGPWQELARLFVDDFPAVYSLMKDRARAKDFQLTLSSFSQILEVMHPTAPNGVPILKTNYASLPKLLSNKGAVDDGTKSHLASVWNTLKDLVEQDPDTFTNDNKYLRGVQTFAPVEMVAVTVLISMYSTTRNNQLLLGDIKALRNALREHFVDLRLNSQVWKFTWEFIEDLEAIRGAVDGSTVNRQLLVQPSQFAPKIVSALVPHSLAASTVPLGKRGIPAVRAKPPQKSTAVKKEQEVSTPSSDLRARKRQRTDSDPANNSSPVINHPNGTETSPHFSNETLALRGPQPTEHISTSGLFRLVATYNASQSTTQQSLSSGSALAKMTLPNTTPSVQRTTTPTQLPHKSPNPTVAMLPNIKSPPQRPQAPRGTQWSQSPYATMAQSQTSNLYVPYSPAHASRPIPAQVRRSRISELNNYRAPIAPMGTSISVSSMSQVAPASPMRLTEKPLEVPLNPRSSNLRAELGAFAAAHTDEEWGGVVKSTSPPMPQEIPAIVPPTPTVPLPAPKISPSEPRPNHKKRRSVTRPTPAQYDGAIDLTSDTEREQERQDLLSSFKGQFGGEKQPQSIGAPAPRASAAPFIPGALIERRPVVVQDVEADELPVGANPYAKFKKNSSAVRP